MFFIRNEVYKPIAMDWDSFTYPLKAGTPISIDGEVANSSDAVGILPHDVPEKMSSEMIYVLVGGDVFKAECEEAYGSTYSDDAISAMDGIRFYTADGTPADRAGGSGGSSGGGVMYLTEDVDGYLNKSYNELMQAASRGMSFAMFYEAGNAREITYPFAVDFNSDPNGFSFTYVSVGSQGHANTTYSADTASEPLQNSDSQGGGDDGGGGPK